MILLKIKEEHKALYDYITGSEMLVFISNEMDNTQKMLTTIETQGKLEIPNITSYVYLINRNGKSMFRKANKGLYFYLVDGYDGIEFTYSPSDKEEQQVNLFDEYFEAYYISMLKLIAYNDFEPKKTKHKNSRLIKKNLVDLSEFT